MDDKQNNDQGKAKRRLKVLHCIWWIPHYRVPIFKLLSQNVNIDFQVLAGDNSKVYGGAKVVSGHEAGSIEGLNWQCVESKRIKGPLFKDFEWQSESVKTVLKGDVDVVITLGYQSLSNMLIRIICRFRGIPVIEWTQGVRREEGGLRWLLRKLYFKWANAFLLYGDFARDFFERHGFGNEELFVVHNSLDYSKQVQIRNSFSSDDLIAVRKKLGVIDECDRLIIHSGRLESQKKLELLIAAVDKLKTNNKKVVLVLVGDGRENDKLVEMVKEREIGDRVVFYGESYDEREVGLLFSASDLCVVPGAVGLIAIHSLVYGTPILTCKNDTGLHGPEVETIKAGYTGDYFIDGDISSLVENMEEMLYPVPVKAKMSQACMDMVDNNYTPEYQERVVLKAINYVLPPEKQVPVP